MAEQNQPETATAPAGKLKEQVQALEKRLAKLEAFSKKVHDFIGAEWSENMGKPEDGYNDYE